MKFIKENEEAVTEILGTVLLLSIVVGVFGLVYINVLGYPLPESSPATRLSTSVENNNIIVEIISGQDLPTDSQIIINIDETRYDYAAYELLNTNAKQDKKWSIGEQVVYSCGENLSSKEIQVYIIDSETSHTYNTGLL